MATTFNVKGDVSDILPLLHPAVKDTVDTIASPQSTAMVPQVPLPPPPTPASAGFAAWSSDPRNITPLAGHMYAPNTPIIPDTVAAPPAWTPSGSGSSLPSDIAAPSTWAANPPKGLANALTPPQIPAPSLYAGSGMSSAVPAIPQAANPSVSELTQDAYFKAHPDQVVKPLAGEGKWWGGPLQMLVSGLAGAAGGLNHDPMAGVRTAQQFQTYRNSIPAQNTARYKAAVIQPEIDTANLQRVQAQTAQERAMADKNGSLADATAPFLMTKEQAAAINHPELAGTMTTPKIYGASLSAAGHDATSVTNNQNTNATHVTTTGMNNKTALANNAANNDRAKLIADAANKTRMLIASMNNATSRANNENTNAHKAGGASGGSFKVPADITKRAALGNNVVENADAVDELLQKNPNIVGAAAGRYSSVQKMIGSNDPDIAELGVRMHNIALASNGAHGVRSQEAIKQTEDEMFEQFKSGPKYIHSALNATRSSMQTFLDDENNFATTGRRTGAGGQSNALAPPKPGGQSFNVTDPNGKVHPFTDKASADRFKKLAGIK